MKLNLQGKAFNIKMMYSMERPATNLGDTVVNISLDDILYIENYNRNTLLHTMKGEYVLTATFSTVKNIVQKDERFQYSHCSYLVNVEKVSTIKENEIEITSSYKSHIIPLTKRRKKAFIEAFCNAKKI